MKRGILFSTCALICILLVPLSSSLAVGSPAKASSARLSFSYEFDSSPKELKRIRVTRGDEKSQFVDDADNYPTDLIHDLLTETPQLKIFFKKNKVPGFDNRHHSFDQTEDESMCRTTLTTQWPNKLRNRKGDLKFIVNQNNSYQPVYVERCEKDVTCTLKEFFPMNYVSECKQKYSVARLVCLSGTTDRNLVVDEFDVACGCVCSIKRI